MALSSHVSVSGNVLVHNGDVGVDVNGSSWSQVTRNISEHNMGGGFLVADDVGPNSHNMIAGNVASHNPGGCGVIIAGHSTAGVTDNLVAANWLSYNGTLKSVWRGCRRRHRHRGSRRDGGRQRRGRQRTSGATAWRA